MRRLNITRRDVLIAGGLAASAAALPRSVQAATPGQMEAAVRNVIGDAKIQKGKVELDLADTHRDVADRLADRKRERRRIGLHLRADRCCRHR